MTRKDYELLADVMRVQHNRAVNSGSTAEVDRVNETVNELSDALRADNARFDYVRFKAAVYGPPKGTRSEGRYNPEKA